jgi:hypothetical protein
MPVGHLDGRFFCLLHPFEDFFVLDAQLGVVLGLFGDRLAREVVLT